MPMPIRFDWRKIFISNPVTPLFDTEFINTVPFLFSNTAFPIQNTRNKVLVHRGFQEIPVPS